MSCSCRWTQLSLWTKPQYNRGLNLGLVRYSNSQNKSPGHDRNTRPEFGCWVLNDIQNIWIPLFGHNLKFSGNGIKAVTAINLMNSIWILELKSLVFRWFSYSRILTTLINVAKENVYILNPNYPHSTMYGLVICNYYTGSENQPFENWTFWSLDFKWSVHLLCPLY